MSETPETTMRPEDVAADPVKLIRAAIADPGRFLPREYEDLDSERVYETIPNWGARAVVAAVLPGHEAMVRAKVAEEIDAEAAKWGDGSPWDGGMDTAARIARGEQP